MLTTKNFSHKNKWTSVTVTVHEEPSPITLIKSQNNDKLDKYFVKIKLRRDPTSDKSDHYEFKMALFDNGESEDFLLFVKNFNMPLKASVMLNSGTNIQYLSMLVHG